LRTARIASWACSISGARRPRRATRRRATRLSAGGHHGLEQILQGQVQPDHSSSP
jgi:hypothetical protein